MQLYEEIDTRIYAINFNCAYFWCFAVCSVLMYVKSLLLVN